jgi:hypothetical protein
VGNVFLRLIGSLALHCNRAACEEYFMGVEARGKQFGVGTRDGCSLMAACIEAHLEANPGHVDISCDLANAFNTFDRSTLWPTLLAKFPNMVRYIVMTYGEAAPVFFREGGDLTTILNSVGSRQGCALGSFLMAVALHPVLQQLAEEFDDVLVTSYCDDVHFTGAPTRVVAAYKRYAELTSSLLQNKLRPDKSEVYAPRVSEAQLRAVGLPVEFVSAKIHSDGLRVLGVPVGRMAFKAGFCKTKVEELVQDCAVLGRVESLQAQHIILTKSLMHSLTNLLRAVPGNETELRAVGEIYDAELGKFAQRYVPWSPLAQHSRKLAFLSLAHGGLGLRSWRDHADAAYVANYVQTSKDLPALYPSLAGAYPPLLSFATRPGPAATDRQYYASQCWNRIIGLAPRAVDVLAADSARHLQHKLSERLDDVRQLDVLGDLIRLDRATDPNHPRHQAQYHSNCEPHALAAIPSDSMTTFSNAVFRTIAARKLLAPLQTPLNGASESLQCNFCHKTTCGETPGSPDQTAANAPVTRRYDGPDTWGDHCFGCTRTAGGARGNLWHDKLRDTWEMLARLAGCSVSHEVTGYIPTSSMRADFAISDTQARTTTLFDVVTCCPTHHNSSRNLCRAAATMPGKAAVDGEIYKRNKWLSHSQQMGLLFVPLAHENGGRMGAAAAHFLDQLVLRLGGSASEQARYRTYASQRIACVNAEGASSLVLSFRNHLRRRGSTVARTASDLRLPQVPEAPVGTHRPRGAATTCPTGTTAPACQNINTGAHATLAAQDLLGGWRVGLMNSSPVVNFEEEQGGAPE